eukprot:Colp12_sorted_trinity150504_noHs@7153
MAYMLPQLKNKKEIDEAIRQTENKVLVLRFGEEGDPTCMKLDDILAKTQQELSLMASIYVIDVNAAPIYISYFDISLIPSTLFFFNAQHIKVDYGTQDHTKFIGAFHQKQDFIDLVEVIYRGAMRGKLMITSPIPPERVPKYNLIYKDI